MIKRNVIFLTKNEIQSGLNRQRHAEGLIRQLPKNHDGRNTWLLNYGVSDEAVELRKKKDLLFLPNTQAAELRNAQLSRLKEVAAMGKAEEKAAKRIKKLYESGKIQ